MFCIFIAFIINLCRIRKKKKNKETKTKQNDRQKSSVQSINFLMI